MMNGGIVEFLLWTLAFLVTVFAVIAMVTGIGLMVAIVIAVLIGITDFWTS